MGRKVKECKTAQCVKCVYYNKWTVTCDYCYITGELRGCPADHCTRRTTRQDITRIYKSVFSTDIAINFEELTRPVRIQDDGYTVAVL